MYKAMAIDDSKAIRRMLMKSLSMLEHEVCPAGNGADAWTLLEQEAPGANEYVIKPLKEEMIAGKFRLMGVLE